jgi:hypothetical protein
MSTRTTSPGGTGGRSATRSTFHWPAPATLAWMLLLVIAMVVASLIGLSLGNL